MKASLWEMREELRASQQHLKEEIMARMGAKIDASQEKMDAWMAEMRTRRKETMACQEAMEV
jgi:hypothetical protein